jgi:hypothetical protein
MRVNFQGDLMGTLHGLQQPVIASARESLLENALTPSSMLDIFPVDHLIARWCGAQMSRYQGSQSASASAGQSQRLGRVTSLRGTNEVNITGVSHREMLNPVMSCHLGSPKSEPISTPSKTNPS